MRFCCRGTRAPGAPSGDQSWYLVSRVSAVRGKDLRDAQPSTDQNGQPNVRFQLTGEGGQRFYNFTSAHVGDSLAVVLDNKVQEVANIKEAIRDTGEISGGSMSQQQAKDLSMILRSGALPAGIKYLEERTVGPSLGTDSIRAGVRAAVVGMLAVLIFMLIYYRAAGINADVALLLNLIILLGFMGYFEAVLTLPGIAGVILTVGMGVDSNVLIFERIREELTKRQDAAIRRGSGFQPCLDHDRGYPRHDHCFGSNFVSVRNRAGEGICGHTHLRSAGELVHGRICFARDLRLDPEPQTAW